MSRLSRFERRILGAMTFSALATLIGALVLGRAALFDAYRVGVHPAVRARLDEGVESHRAHLDTLRREAETIADAIAFHRSFPGAGTPTAPFDAPSPDEDPEPEGFGGFDEDLEALDEPAPATEPAP